MNYEQDLGNEALAASQRLDDWIHNISLGGGFS